VGTKTFIRSEGCTIRRFAFAFAVGLAVVVAVVVDAGGCADKELGDW
jgi:hypothetical protein